MKNIVLCIVFIACWGSLAADNASLNGTNGTLGFGIPPMPTMQELGQPLPFEEALSQAVSTGISSLFQKHTGEAGLVVLALFVGLGLLVLVKFLSAVKAVLGFFLAALLLVACYIIANWAVGI